LGFWYWFSLFILVLFEYSFGFEFLIGGVNLVPIWNWKFFSVSSPVFDWILTSRHGTQ